MAVRLNGAHQADVRLKIKTSQLVNRLQGFALGEVDGKTKSPIDMDGVRLKAIEVLLRKVLPDLATVTITGDPDAPLIHVIARQIVDPAKL